MKSKIIRSALLLLAASAVSAFAAETRRPAPPKPSSEAALRRMEAAGERAAQRGTLKQKAQSVIDIHRAQMDAADAIFRESEAPARPAPVRRPQPPSRPAPRR